MKKALSLIVLVTVFLGLSATQMNVIGEVFSANW